MTSWARRPRSDSVTSWVGHQTTSWSTFLLRVSATGTERLQRLPVPQPVLQPVEAGPLRAVHPDRVGPAVDLGVEVPERAVGVAQRLVLQVRRQPVAARGGQVPAADRGGERRRLRRQHLDRRFFLGHVLLGQRDELVIGDRHDRRGARRVPGHGDRGPLLRVEVGEGAEEGVLARADVEAHRGDGGRAGVLDLGVDRAVGRVDQVDLGAAGPLVVDLERVPAGLGAAARPRRTGCC